MRFQNFVESTKFEKSILLELPFLFKVFCLNFYVILVILCSISMNRDRATHCYGNALFDAIITKRHL